MLCPTVHSDEPLKECTKVGQRTDYRILNEFFSKLNVGILKFYVFFGCI